MYTHKSSEKMTVVDAPHSARGVFPWLIRFFKGILVGIGAILPGLSGGVLSVIFGFYTPLIQFLSNIKEKFWANIRYFIPVGLGVLGGIFIFSVFVEKAFGSYTAQFVCLFIGFVIGTFPSLYKTAGKKGRSHGDVFILVIFAVLIFGLMYVGRGLPKVAPSIPVWFVSGMLVALGFVVPGMSPSNFLIYFGLYDKMAAGIKSLDVAMLIPFAAGGVLCVILFSKLVASLFKHFYSKMYHAILGMVIGSTVGIFPAIILPAYAPAALDKLNLSFPLALLFGAGMLIAGIVVSYLFSKLEEKVEAN